MYPPLLSKIQLIKQTKKIPDAKCTFGSGQNQMTMTYISFTGWLRSLQCDFHLVLWQHSLETGIHFDSHANQVFWWIQCKFIFCNCKHGGSAKDSSGRLLLMETSFEGWLELIQEGMMESRENFNKPFFRLLEKTASILVWGSLPRATQQTTIRGGATFFASLAPWHVCS